MILPSIWYVCHRDIRAGMADCSGVHVPEQDLAACMRAYAQSTAHARVRNCRNHT